MEALGEERALEVWDRRPPGALPNEKKQAALLAEFNKELAATKAALAEATARLEANDGRAAPAPRDALDALQRDLDATRAEADALRARLDDGPPRPEPEAEPETAAAGDDGDGGLAAARAALDDARAALDDARASEAAAVKRCRDVEKASETLRTGADLVRRKFEALEREITTARETNAKLKRQLNGSSDARAPPLEPEDRFEYLKNLMMEFLANPDDAAKAHMERAILVVLGFSKDDEKRLLDKKEEAAKRAAGGLLAFFG